MKDLNIAIVGLGYFGRFHAKAVQGISGLHLAAVVGREFKPEDDVLLPASVARHNDAAAVFADATIDAVLISTPPSTHIGLIKEAVKAGKHILVEKPAVGSVEELAELRAILTGYDKRFMAGHIYCFNSKVRAMKKLIADGAIGTVRYANFRQLSRGPIRTDADCLWEIGVHHLSIMDYLFDASPLSVATGIAGKIVLGGQDDYTSVGLGYANGVTATITVSWFSSDKDKQSVVVGDKGIIVFDDVARQVSLLSLPYPDAAARAAQTSIWLDASVKATPVETESKDPMIEEWEHFAECIRAGTEPLTGLTHTARITEQLDFISKHIVRPT